LKRAVELVRIGETQQAIQRVRENTGREFMDRARALIGRMIVGESERLEQSRSIAAAVVRIDQTWLARSGGLAPISLPLFHG